MRAVSLLRPIALCLWLPLACAPPADDALGAGAQRLDGSAIAPLAEPAAAHVLVFVGSECPISNRYAPEIQRLAARFGATDVRFWLVYPDGEDDAAAIEAHRAAYGYGLPALRDVEHALVRASGVEVTPEVAVFVAGKRLYRGRIDDRVVALDKSRPAATRNDLAEVLEAVARGEARVFPARPAVGCAIPELS